MIIGITGTLGAGKGTIAEFLESKGFVHNSARKLICEFLKERQLDLSRENMVSMANELRANYGNSFIVTKWIERSSSSDMVIESIRSMGEVEELRKNNAVLFAVDADIKTRYDRITQRKSSTDMVSFEQFKEQEERESEGQGSQQQLKSCMESADYKFDNNGTKEELFSEIEKVLSKIKDGI